MMRVQDLMQKEVSTLRVADHLDIASDILELGEVRHLLILDREKVVGILSRRDLLRAPGISSMLRPAMDRAWLAKICVREVMCKEVMTIGPEESLSKAVGLMLRLQISCLPVVDAGKLVGLLSENDLLVLLEHWIDREDAPTELTVADYGTAVDPASL